MALGNSANKADYGGVGWPFTYPLIARVYFPWMPTLLLIFRNFNEQCSFSAATVSPTAKKAHEHLTEYVVPQGINHIASREELIVAVQTYPCDGRLQRIDISVKNEVLESDFAHAPSNSLQPMLPYTVDTALANALISAGLRCGNATPRFHGKMKWIQRCMRMI